MAIPPGYLRFDGFKWVIDEEVGNISGPPGPEGPEGPAGTGGGAVIFDGPDSGPENLRSDRATQQSPIDNTLSGIVNFGVTTYSGGVNSNFSTLVGGANNSIGANAGYDFVGGGLYNNINEDTYHSGSLTYSVIVGGANNSVAAVESFIGGGFNNSITGGEGGSGAEGNSILGGYSNTITSSAGSAILGGIGNTITNTQRGAILNGSNNNLGPNCSQSIISGSDNTIDSNSGNCVIAGGDGNLITNSAGNTTIGGGASNTAQGSFATIPGGASNTATGDYSFACGIGANAYREMQWAWSASGVFTALGDQPQYSKFMVKGQTSGATPLVLSADLFGPVSLDLQNGVAYMIRAHCLANRQGVAGRAYFVNTILAHASAGTAVIDNNNVTLAITNGTSWTIGYTTSGANVIATFTGTAGQTVRAVVYYEFVEIPGGA